MKNIFFFVLLIAVWITSCKKNVNELDISGNLHISYKLDRQLITETANDTTGNGNGYKICTTIPSCHFGYGASWGLIGFRLGQINLSQPQTSFSAFKSLFSKGIKIYDSLQIYGQLNENRVEVFYQDENGKNWSTTHLRFDTSGWVERTVNQPGSNFMIDEIKEVKVNGQPGGVKIKGRFNCTVYEENGTRQKVITDAEFIALIFKLD